MEMVTPTKPSTPAPPSRILWMDLEMTGLDVQKEVIIEVAAIVTDFSFNEFDTYHAVVRQEQKYLDAMDEWNKRTHTESGLVAQIPGGKIPDVVESDLMDLVQRNFGVDKPILAGNSISQDRLFIDHYFKRLSHRLHYRMLDVTAWKVVFNSKYSKTFAKKNSHKAIDDIRESINELRYYLGFVKTEC